jgi:hypothetical protein
MDADSLIALGAEHGFEFSAGDLAAGAELSDEELDGVAGGALSVYTNVASFKLDGTKYRIGTKHAPGTGTRLNVYDEKPESY